MVLMLKGHVKEKKNTALMGFYKEAQFYSHWCATIYMKRTVRFKGIISSTCYCFFNSSHLQKLLTIVSLFCCYISPLSSTFMFSHI